MNELFAIPETPLTALQSARTRYDKAVLALEECEAGFWTNVRDDLRRELSHAEKELAAAESAELQRINQSPASPLENRDQ